MGTGSGLKMSPKRPKELSIPGSPARMTKDIFVCSAIKRTPNFHCSTTLHSQGEPADRSLPVG